MSSLDVDFNVTFLNQPNDDENNEILQNVFDNNGIIKIIVYPIAYRTYIFINDSSYCY